MKTPARKKIAELKAYAYEIWAYYQRILDAEKRGTIRGRFEATSPYEDEAFKAGVRKLVSSLVERVDLRRKEVWEYAIAALRAEMLLIGSSDNHFLVQNVVNLPSSDWDFLTAKILQALCFRRSGLDRILRGIKSNLEYPSGLSRRKITSLLETLKVIVPPERWASGEKLLAAA